MNKWLYPSIVAAVAVIAVAGVTVWRNTQTNTNTTATDNGVGIEQLAAGAFGSFSGAEREALDSAGLTAAANEAAQRDTTAIAVGSSEPGDLIAPDEAGMKRYEYIFSGRLEMPVLPVLRRRVDVVDLTSGFNTLNLFNQTALDNVKVQYLTAVEDGDDGWTVSLDYQNASASFYRVTPDLAVAVEDLKADAPAPTDPNIDQPDDDELTAIADRWLAEFGISRDGLGQPETRTSAMLYATARAATEAMYYQPELTVVYPWLINGQSVYDDNGNKYGLTVNINASDKAVTAVYNIVALKFAASDYALETDQDKILAVAKRGGLYGYQPEPGDGVTTVTVELGQPTSGYLISRYQLAQNSDEYLIPALIFPVTSVPVVEEYLPSKVIVPLVAELLDQADDNNRIFPVTVEESGTSSGSAGLPD